MHGQRTYYHYSDQGLVAELDATGTLLKSYGYKPGSPWGTDPLYVRQGGRNYWYLTDHLGTPQQIAAENGAVVWQAQYEVFGKAEVDAGSSVTNNLRFPGQYYDAETGLHYNWNRYYDPEAGRYTQTDPIGFEGGDVNLYGYVGGKSVNFIDPLGLAYFSYRPLGGAIGLLGVIGGHTDDIDNTVIGHEQLFFEDGNPISNIGFFADGTIQEESDVSKYKQSHDSGWNDCIMREAVKSVANRKKYKLLWEHKTGYKYNCQDWADTVRREYRRLAQDSAIQNICNPTCDEISK